MSGVQYRVRWQREGQVGKRSQTFATHVAALRCVERQRTAHEDLREWFSDGEGHVDESRVPKPLIWGPVINTRTVGEWEEL